MTIEPQTVRIQGGIYDRQQPGWEADPEHASRGIYLAPVKYAAPGLAVIDHGAKVGRKVYHVPTDGTPGLAIPACAPKSRRYLSGLVDGSWTGFRTLRDARAYMLAVSAAGILPTDRKAEHAEINALSTWLETHIDSERGEA